MFFFDGKILLTVSLGGVFFGYEVGPRLFFDCFYSGSGSVSKMRIRIREAPDCGSGSGSGLPLQSDGVGTSKPFALSIRRFCSRLDINYDCVVEKLFLEFFFKIIINNFFLLFPAGTGTVRLYPTV